MPSDMRWKRDESAFTRNYSGSNGSERRDKAKRDLYQQGKIDAPTEEAMNRYFKKDKGSRERSDANRVTSADSTTFSPKVYNPTGTGGVGPLGTTYDPRAYGQAYDTAGGVGPSGTAYDPRSYGSFYGSAAMPRRQDGTYDPPVTQNKLDENGQPIINTAGQGTRSQGNIAAATQPGTMSANGTATTTRDMSPDTLPSIQQQQNYSYTNPEEALMNVLMDMGVPLYDATVANGLMPMAGSLADAFGIQQALMGDNGGQGMAGDLYQSFLNNVLSGNGVGVAGRGNGVYGVLQNALGALTGSVLPEVLRHSIDVTRTGGQITNPFISRLQSLLTNPQDILTLRQSLMEPLMGSELAQAQARQGALGFIGARRQRAVGNIPAGQFDYIRALTGY